MRDDEAWLLSCPVVDTSLGSPKPLLFSFEIEDDSTFFFDRFLTLESLLVLGLCFDVLVVRVGEVVILVEIDAASVGDSLSRRLGKTLNIQDEVNQRIEGDGSHSCP